MQRSGLLLRLVRRRELAAVVAHAALGAIRADARLGDQLDRALALDKIEPTKNQLGKHVIRRRALLRCKLLRPSPRPGRNRQLSSMTLPARRAATRRRRRWRSLVGHRPGVAQPQLRYSGSAEVRGVQTPGGVERVMRDHDDRVSAGLFVATSSHHDGRGDRACLFSRDRDER